MYIDSLVTNILKIKIIIQDNTEHKTCRRHIPFTVNSLYYMWIYKTENVEIFE